MTVRSLDLLDLPFLQGYRRDVLPLDSARYLTRGNPLGAFALLSYLNPRRTLYTALATGEHATLMGQVLQREGESSARLTFLAPAGRINGLALPLLEHLTHQAGEWGAFHLLAEVDEDSPAFPALRAAGFSMYAWQRVWKLPRLSASNGDGLWQMVAETDWPAIQSLHGQIVPALIQPVDALPKQAGGLLCRLGGTLQAYVSVNAGAEGIWVQPLVPPDSNCKAGTLASLADMIPGWNSRPVYICVRSYQAWLETALQELGAEGGPRQAVMVKRLVAPIREGQTLSMVEKALAKAKPAAPVSRTDSKGGTRA